MEIKEERFPCDFDHMYASMAEHDSAAAAAEVRQLKDLLLLHLDLIQQQSEQLVNKDKQLCNLRQENDMVSMTTADTYPFTYTLCIHYFVHSIS